MAGSPRRKENLAASSRLRSRHSAAVNVDPDTAQRDLAIPTALQRRLGHGDCGIYAEVIAGGTISADDTIAAEQPELL